MNTPTMEVSPFEILDLSQIIENTDKDEFGYLGDLPENAYSTLGYSQLKREAEANNNTLAKILNSLSITVYTTESVVRYKNEVYKEINNTSNKKVGTWLRITGAAIVLIGILILTVGLFLPGVESVFGWALGALLLGFIITLVGADLCMDDYYWRSTALSSYTDKVPPFALMHAIAIKRNLPEAKFYVHSLQEVDDPFLQVIYYGEAYFIAFWNEVDYKIEEA